MTEPERQTPTQATAKWSAGRLQAGLTTQRCTDVTRLRGRRGSSRTPPGTHAQVIKALTSSRDRQFKSIGWRLEQCREKRVKADYHLADDFTVADAQLMAAQCEKIWATAGDVYNV